MEKVQNDVQPGVINDTALENTLSDWNKGKKIFNERFNIAEQPNGDIFWNNIPIDLLGDSTIKITDNVYKIFDNLRKVFSATTEKPLKKLSDLDKVMFEKFLTSPN